MHIPIAFMWFKSGHCGDIRVAIGTYLVDKAVEKLMLGNDSALTCERYPGRLKGFGHISSHAS